MNCPYYDILDLGDPNRPTTKLFHLVPAGSRVLDIGCATGYLAQALGERKGCRVTGIEVDAEAARRAAASCERIFVGDVEAPRVLAQAGGLMAAACGGFGAIIMADVLEHLRRPDELLPRLRALLAPEGLLLLSVPNVAHFTVRKELLLGRFERTERGILDRSHRHFFTLASLRRLLDSSGYAVEHLDISFSMPGKLTSALRLLGPAYRRVAAPLLARIARRFPGFFALQFVIAARPRRCARF
jgi:SAM-dependent methyltransferase